VRPSKRSLWGSSAAPVVGPSARRRGRHSRLSLGAVCAAVAALLLAALPSGAQADTADVEPNLNYVALGDSYSSGEGNRPFQDGTAGGGNHCHRSNKAYPYSIASRYETKAPQFYACSGAETKHILTDERYGEQPQIDRPGVDETANLVTVTIGGNDADFSDVIKACVKQRWTAAATSTVGAVGRWLGFLDPDPSCSNSESFRADVRAKIESVYDEATATYKELRAQTDAEHTSIIAADYPKLFPTTEEAQKCKGLRPFLTPEVQDWMNFETGVLTAQLTIAAQTAGVNKITVDDYFEGHGVCGNNGAWINGVSPSSAWWPVLVGSFHPNADGHSLGYGAAFNDYIANATDLTPEGLPANPDPIPEAASLRAKSEASASTESTLDLSDLQVRSIGATDPRCEGVVRAGHQARVSGSGFASSTPVDIYTTSPGQANLEKKVATVTSSYTGEIDTTITIPWEATGFAPEDTENRMIGIDAIGNGDVYGERADSLALVEFAEPYSQCDSTNER